MNGQSGRTVQINFGQFKGDARMLWELAHDACGPFVSKIVDVFLFKGNRFGSAEMLQLGLTSAPSFADWVKKADGWPSLNVAVESNSTLASGQEEVAPVVPGDETTACTTSPHSKVLVNSGEVKSVVEMSVPERLSTYANRLFVAECKKKVWSLLLDDQLAQGYLLRRELFEAGDVLVISGGNLV
jgi:hypothetical protein